MRFIVRKAVNVNAIFFFIQAFKQAAIEEGNIPKQLFHFIGLLKKVLVPVDAMVIEIGVIAILETRLAAKSALFLGCIQGSEK